MQYSGERYCGGPNLLYLVAAGKFLHHLRLIALKREWDKLLAKNRFEFPVRENHMPGLFTLRRFEHKDFRGSFSRLFDMEELIPVGWPPIAGQVNFSITSLKGSIRGMHAQPGGIPEYKLVTCIRGAVWDVCVDLRANSTTFLSSECVELSAGNALSLLIPPGVAHGFQTMSDDVEIVYCHSAPFDPDSEFGVSPFDPLLGVSWPLEVTSISDRDRNHSLLPSTFEGLSV